MQNHEKTKLIILRINIKMYRDHLQLGCKEMYISKHFSCNQGNESVISKVLPFITIYSYERKWHHAVAI